MESMVYSGKTTVCREKIPAKILSDSTVKLVILTSSQQFVDIADIVARQVSAETECSVIWLKYGNEEELKKQFSGLPGDLAEVRAFSASPSNEVALILTEAEPMDLTRIQRAFIKASKI